MPDQNLPPGFSVVDEPEVEASSGGLPPGFKIETTKPRVSPSTGTAPSTVSTSSPPIDVKLPPPAPVSVPMELTFGAEKTLKLPPHQRFATEREIYPSGANVKEGYQRIGEGVKDLGYWGRKPQVAKGLANLTGGAMKVLGESAEVAPVKTAAEFGGAVTGLMGGMATGEAVHAIAPKLGATPEQTEATANIAGLLAGHQAGKIGARFGGRFSPKAEAPSPVTPETPETPVAETTEPSRIEKIKTAASNLGDTLQSTFGENLRSFDEDPETQTRIRRSVHEVGRAIAKQQINEDMPKIHKEMRDAGLEDETFHQMLQWSRLVGKEEQLRNRAQLTQGANPIKLINNKDLDTIARDLDMDYQAGVSEKLNKIREDAGLTPDQHFEKWEQEQFDRLPNGNLQAGNGVQVSPQRAREIFDTEVEQAVRNSARESKAVGDWQAALPQALTGVRARDMMSRTYQGIAGAIRDNRERVIPLSNETFEQIKELPQFKKALSIYKFGMDPETMTANGLDPSNPDTLALLRERTGGETPIMSSIEGLYRKHHAQLEGAEGHLGPLDTYYPLLAESADKKAGKFTDIFRNKYVPFNPASFHTSGLGKYSTGVDNLTNHLATMIFQGRKAEAVSKLSEFGGLKPINEKVAMEAPPEGYEILKVSPDYFERLSEPDPFGVQKVKHPGQAYLATHQVARELKPWLEKASYGPGSTGGLDPLALTDKAVGDAIRVNLLGPGDNINFLGRVSAIVPTQLSRLPSNNLAMDALGPVGPLVKAFRGLHNVATIDPKSPKTISDIREAMNEGAFSPRYAKISTNQQLAKDIGAEWAGERKLLNMPNPLSYMDAFLYGPNGLDMRVRLTLWRAHKEAFPTATAQERARFVNAIGNYNRTLQSAFERELTTSRAGQLLAPFVQTGLAYYKTGVQTALGAKVLPRLQPGVAPYVKAQLSTGMAGYLATWAALNYVINGKYPWDDPKGGKVGAIKLNDNMVRKLEPWIGNQNGKPVYVDALKFPGISPYLFTDKGMQALGTRGGINEAMIQGRGTGTPGIANFGHILKDAMINNDHRATQVFVNGFLKDALNAAAAPFSMGPAIAGTAGFFGRSPYITRFEGFAPPQLLNIRKPRQTFAGEAASAVGRAVSQAAGMDFVANAFGATADTDRLDKSKMSPIGSGIYSLMGVLPNLRPYVGSPEMQQKRENTVIKSLTRQGNKEAAKPH